MPRVDMPEKILVVDGDASFRRIVDYTLEEESNAPGAKPAKFVDKK